jgi:CubicO group peptidase (beta-lactamase class C family)
VTSAEQQQTGVRLYRGECDAMKQNLTMLSFMKLVTLSCLLLAPSAAGTAQQSPTPGLAKSYGNADSERSLPANQDTAYRIGSITKMFTATMLEQLVEAGKVNLSDPVEKYFPEVNKVPKRYNDTPPITLLQLATHTSGLSREPDHTPAYVTGKPEDWKET